MKDLNRPLIVVTNDDGYLAPGLNELIKMVKPYGDIIVVAPEKGASGMSHAITMSTPMRIIKTQEYENVVIYKVNGTPADCVKLALNQLTNKIPDVLVSGINHGSNSSISVIYSGTMGGALEGCLNGIPSIGISLDDHSMSADFSLVTKYCEPIFKQVLEKGLPKNTALNINFPVCRESEFKGMKVCRQAQGSWKEEYDKRVDPHGGTYYWLTGHFQNLDNGSEETDIWALSNNYASIVPVNTDFTNHKVLNDLNMFNIEANENK